LRPVHEQQVAKGEARFLEQFMFDLSPFKKNYAWTSARERARRHLSGNQPDAWCREVAEQAELWLLNNRDAFAAANGSNANAIAVVHDLIARLKNNVIVPAKRLSRALIDSAAGLLYLVNRYDEIFDTYGSAGLVDDVERIEELGRQLHRDPSIS